VIVAFSRDVGCRHDLLWRCDLAPRHAAGLVPALLAAGFRDATPCAADRLRVLEQPGAGHRIVVVARTGRVQVRLDALTPAHERVGEARRLFALVSATCTPPDADD
jgi:hypothetical protein